MTKKEPVRAQFFLLGDKVLWRGHKLTVVEIRETDHSIEALSTTFRVRVYDSAEFQKCEA